METFTHAEGNLDDEVFEKSKSGSDTDVESGLEKLEGRLWTRGGGVLSKLFWYPTIFFFLETATIDAKMMLMDSGFEILLFYYRVYSIF